MAIIKIKIQDLFDRLDMNDEPETETSFKINDDIYIKGPDGFVLIKEYVKKRCDSYKYIFSNGKSLICSKDHIIYTSNGCKKIKNVTKSVYIPSNDGPLSIIKSELFKKDDVLYDFCLDFPHLFEDYNGIIHHNSLVIAYVIKTIIENDESSKCIIIVPNKSLVEQFYDDMNDYGMSKRWNVGRVYAKKKEWDSDIVIATWQTMMRNHDKLPLYDVVIVDETHLSKAYQLKKQLAKATNAKYRLGFTGTLHAGKLDNLNTFSYLGPVIAEYSSGNLAEDGYISKCNVKVLNIDYTRNFEGTYNEVKDEVFQNKYRLSVIKSIINKADHNVLLLVGKVEKEGDYLKDWLKDVTKKEVVFISGRDKTEEREKWRKACMKRKDIALIATYAIFSQGINIPNLKYIVLASPFKSKVRTLQSIGRALRKYSNKKDGAVVYDILDNVKYLSKHGVTRYRYYGSEGFNVEDEELKEVVF